MSYANWKVGDRVVLVREIGGKDHPKLAGVTWPHIGSVYTIRETGYVETSYGSGVVIWLKEISNPVVKFRDIPVCEVGFAARLFRKVQPRKTDISIFEAILHGARVPEDA